VRREDKATKEIVKKGDYKMIYTKREEVYLGCLSEV